MTIWENMLQEEKIESLEFQLQDYIIDIIKNDLTIKLIKNNKKPYTDEEIDNFIYGHEDEILTCIERMIQDYKEANTLDDLEHVPNECIQNYLYKLIDFSNI